MQWLAPIAFLLAIFALLSTRLQGMLRTRLWQHPASIIGVPIGLSLIFCLIADHYNALSLALVLLILGYTLAPTICAWVQRAQPSPTLLDLITILMLWLPVELALGAELIPRLIRGFMHTVVYGIATVLALFLLLLFRGLKEMKYNLPRGKDLLYALIGFVCVAPVLIAIGLWLSFIPPFHMPANFSFRVMTTRFLLILAGTALPEEILFRSLIQNWLMQRLGSTDIVLALAAVIFGSAHLNNGPGPLPNWRYAILATIAGFVYGKVFQKGSSVFASAILHAMVNTTRHTFF